MKLKGVIKIKRTDNSLAKSDRMNKTLRHEEADRIPIKKFLARLSETLKLLDKQSVFMVLNEFHSFRKVI